MTYGYETDEQLKTRLRYVAGDGQWMLQQIAKLSGRALDELAETFGLKRRTVVSPDSSHAPAPTINPYGDWG